MDVKRNTLVNGLLFAAVTAGAIAGSAGDWQVLGLVCTPLMLIVLSSWFFFNSRRVGDRFTLLVQAGLFFSLVGDLAFMFQGRDGFNFILGLAAYFIAHLCYTVAFALNLFDMEGTGGAIIATALAAGVLLFGVFFTLDLLGNAGVDTALKVPLGAFAVMMTLMGIFAAYRFKRTFPRSFWLVFVGALLLILSDVLLADRKFNLRPIRVPEAWMLLSYALAQFMIAGGCLLHVLDPEMIRKRQALAP